MEKRILPLFLLLLFSIFAKSAKILVVAPMPSYSQFSIPFKLATELASRNHEVTCINSYPQKNPINNYKDVPVKENIEIMEDEKKKLFELEQQGVMQGLTFLFDLMSSLTEHTLKNKNVEKLLASNKEFDVIIIETFLNDAFVGLGYRFKAPVILLSGMGSSPMNNHIFANPAPVSYIPGLGGTLTKHMDFWERTENLLMNAVFEALVQFYHMPKQRRIFNKYITTDCELDDVLYNVSLMFANSHVSVSDPVPHVPNIIEIGGFHINPPKKLPLELQTFLDSAEEGVILFSMGSNLRSQDLKPNVRDAILRAFSKIKQEVLWKFETDLPNVSKNVKILPWLPQQDILAHPNIRAFISHGGFLSILETVYYGVPVIGIPVFGDQLNNIAKAVKNGYAIYIDLEDLSEEKLSWALNEILNNPKYRENVQYRSKLMHDQPLKPIDLAIFWVEHVIRHGGAKHLRSAGLDLKWYQREMIDIILFLISSTIMTLIIFYIVYKKIVLFLFRKKTKIITKLRKDN